MSRPVSSNAKIKKIKKTASGIDNISSSADDLHSSDTKNKLTRPLTEFEPLETVVEKDSPLAYVVVSKEESEELLQMTPSEIESKFQEKFQLNSEIDLKDASILDCYVGAVHWCQKQGFNPHQLSIFFTIVHNLLKKIEDHASLVSLTTEFHNLLFGSSDSFSPFNDRFFSIHQIKAITDYISSGLFHHYNLYRYVMTFPQAMDIITDDLFVEQPFKIHVPLDEGLPEETLTRFLNLQTPVILMEDDRTEVVTTPNIETELPSNLDNIFVNLTLEDVQAVINEACAAVLNNLQTDLEDKIQQQEDSTMAKISKVSSVKTSAKKSCVK